MKKRKKISSDLTAARVFSVGLMFTALLFLTSINFFLYPPANKDIKISAGSSDGSQTNLPAFPVEEKSGTSSISIVEELMHENHFQLNHVFLLPPAGFGHLSSGDLATGHAELISPPPEL